MANNILNNVQIHHILDRVSYQIQETFFDDKKIILVGINGNGFELAKLIYKKLEEKTSYDVLLTEIEINKKNVHDNISIQIDESQLSNANIILIDDVLHTGKTLIYSLKYLLNFDVNKIKTVVLIDRNHKNFPVKADFKGISLSTSLQNHVSVHVEENNVYAILE